MAHDDHEQYEASSDVSPEGTSIKKHRPLLARLLTRLGIPVKPETDRILEWVQILAIASFLAWFLISFVTVRMWVPSESMEPTILPGDSFFIDRVSYLWGLREPQPGDIIVFWHTQEGMLCRSGFWIFRWGELKPCRERLVKRLIAVAGQNVAIRQGQIYIDGQPLTDSAFQRDYLCDPVDAHAPPALRTRECRWTVPTGHYFVMGDNTRNSNDSRYWGYLDAREFIGEPFFRVWPVSRIGPMNGYLASPR